MREVFVSMVALGLAITNPYIERLCFFSLFFFFFFSSRRRHTRYWRDWSSDVCSSDLDPRDRPYHGVIRLALIVFRLFRFHFDVRGQEHVPATGGAFICSNHVSFLDFAFLGLAALPQHRLVRFMAKAAVFTNRFSGPFMRAMHHIPVDRQAGAAAFDSAVRALKDGQVVGVFPEATISTSFTVKDLKAGVARMAVDAGVPILPAAVWGGHRIATKGHDVVLRRDVPGTAIIGDPPVAEAGGGPPSLLRRAPAARGALVEVSPRPAPH